MDSFACFFRFNGFKKPTPAWGSRKNKQKFMVGNMEISDSDLSAHPTAKSSSILVKTYFSYLEIATAPWACFEYLTKRWRFSSSSSWHDHGFPTIPVEILGWPGLESRWHYYYCLAVSDFVNSHAAHQYNEARASQYNHNQFLVPLAKQYRGIIYKNSKLWRSVRLPLPAVPDLKSGDALVIYSTES